MTKINPGIRVLSCGCLFNTNQKTKTCHIYPCTENCSNLSMALSMAQSDGQEIQHVWEQND